MKTHHHQPLRPGAYITGLLLLLLFLAMSAVAQPPPGWTSIDAAVNWGNGKAYFFKGNGYVRYDIAADRTDPGYPAIMNDYNWPGVGNVFSSIDAAINMGNGKAYFFSGNKYIRYDIAAERADPGYPATMDGNNWPGVGNVFSRIDAAINMGNGKAYFFSGNQYIRYDIAADRADPGYPATMNGNNWPGVGDKWTSVDAAIEWDKGKVFFFNGNQYIRYDIAADKADPGYPAAISPTSWPGWGVKGSDPVIYNSYIIKSCSNGFMLDQSAIAPNGNRYVEAKPASGSQSQTWTFRNFGDNNYYLLNEESGLAITVESSNPNSKVRLISLSELSCNQLFFFSSLARGSIRLDCWGKPLLTLQPDNSVIMNDPSGSVSLNQTWECVRVR